ncbi:MAG TPA: DUF1015 domain-containing protein [Clostridia bacterium]|nr:DUF1015 domain-containing protein [Clostridia bacterium]
MYYLPEHLGLAAPDILIPRNPSTKWSVVACDQYTSEPEYWEQAAEFVGDEPSTLKLILPEAYLEGNTDDMIKNINDTMDNYLAQGIFRTIESSFIYVERTLANGKVRHGLVAAVDLEKYDYNAGSTSLIRATEGTIASRIPPRVKVRMNAPLELPHIMLLIDDPDKTVIEPLGKVKSKMEKLYDFTLMKNGGNIAGWAVKEFDAISSALDGLIKRHVYNYCNKPVLLYAVGDGNHSLATAKECWERVKKTLSDEAIANHPARYALAEIVNLHDDSLNFEPIHRVLFDVNPDEVIAELLSHYPGSYTGIGNGHVISFYSAFGEGNITVPSPESNLTVGTLQRFLDEYIKSHNANIDYIHGDDTVKALAEKNGGLAFILPPMKKSELFETVILDGVLPRKTFSMGHAWDKRYYLECRKIIA